MHELMIKLLTYEPFEKISGDEKAYVFTDEVAIDNF